jgi:dihydroorotase-like cyclic amidohydrolase
MASETPAEIWGLTEKRKSSAGADADLVILYAEGMI